MKKVLLVVPLSTLDWGARNAGGVDTVCQMLVKHLVENPSRDFHYRVLAFDPFHASKYTGEVISLSENLEVVICPMNEKRWGGGLPGFASQALRVTGECERYSPDVVHVHVANWLLGVKRRYTRIATLHTYKNIARKPVSWANDFLYVKIMPSLCNLFVDQYTCVGNILKDTLVQDVGKSISVIGNPIDDAYFIEREIATANSEELKLVTCALISRRKRIDRAIALVYALKKQGKSVHLSIIGPSVDSQYMSELETQVVELNLGAEISFLGQLNRSQIISEYKRSEVGLFFSDQETFGLAPLEMLAAGLRLVSTKVGILEEREVFFGAQGVAFVFKDSDVQNDLSSIERVMTNDYCNAKELKDGFSVSGVIRAYEKFYVEHV